MTPEERAVINAAIKTHAIGREPTGPQQSALRQAVHKLIFACSECNAGGHTCGCGDQIGHADSICGDHDDAVTKPSEERRHLADQLREIAQGTMQEWMRIVDLEDVAGIQFQARVRWQNDDGECIVGESQYSEEYGAFRLTVRIEDLGPLPPIGPENDPALQVEMEAEQPSWITRTWVDVRAGDRVRLPGTEHVAVVESVVALPWHVHPAADSYRPNEKPAEWTEIKVRLAGRLGLLSMSPAAPIEIELTASELAAIEALGWANRVRMEITE